METTFVWAGVWTSVTVGGMLLVPVIVDFFKRNLPICFGILMTLLTLGLLSPHSPELRSVWVTVTQLPIKLLDVIVLLVTRLLGG